MRVVALMVLMAAGTGSTLPAQERWRLVEELRIGTLDEGPASFADIRGIATNAKGWIFVLEHSTQDIRIFDAQGKHVKTVGRKGSGPGEFRNANGMVRGSGQIFWINDPANARFTAIDQEGEYLRSVSTQPWGYGFIWDAHVTNDGRLAEVIPARDAAEPRVRLRVYTSDLTVADVLDLPDCNAGRKPMEIYVFERPGGSAHLQVPFSPYSVAAHDPAGFVWCGWSEKYELRRIAIGRGDTVAVARGTAEPTRVTARERDSTLARIRERYPGAKPDPSRIPGDKPILTHVFVGGASQLWVRLPGLPTRYDVFGPDGKLLATAEADFTPSRWIPSLVENDRFYTVVRDADDIPYVVRARIVRTR